MYLPLTMLCPCADQESIKNDQFRGHTQPRPYVVILARREPEHPVMVLADYYLTTPLYQPTWVKLVFDSRKSKPVVSQ